MTKLSTTLLLLCTLAAPAQEIPAPAPHPLNPNLVTMEIDGVTLAEAVGILNKLGGGANIVLAGGPLVESRRLPKMSLRNSRLEDILYTLQSVANLEMDSTDDGEEGVKPIYILKPILEQNEEGAVSTPPAPSVLPIGVGALIDGGLRFEDVQEAVRTAWAALQEVRVDHVQRMAEAGLSASLNNLIRPNLTFHAGSRLMIVTGDPESLACAHHVVEQIRLNLAAPKPVAPASAKP